MRKQLSHLIDLGQLPNVSIQVVPYSAAANIALDGPYTLLAFEDYPNVLYVESFMGCQYFEKAEEVAHASVVFDHLRASALNSSDSARLIKRVVAEINDD